ncbi:hypothetical protein BU15DRAFT_83045 [Melanogaster broomeanus]|nr:hypothetical protein BU15DRAFT_83045 [Melanogaster broomeanus]
MDAFAALALATDPGTIIHAVPINGEQGALSLSTFLSGRVGEGLKTPGGDKVPTTAGRAVTKQVLQEQNSKLRDENDALKERLQQADEAIKAAEIVAQEAEAARRAVNEKMKKLNTQGNTARGLTLEPKPPVTMLKAGVHDLVSRVRMDFDVPYNKQPPAQLGKLFKLTRRRHEYLEKFENDWPTAELVKQYLQNKRKAKKRKAVESSNSNGDGHVTKRTRFDDFDDFDDGEVSGGGEHGGSGGISEDDD